MGEEYIKDGFKLKIGRRRTHITTYENMILQTTQPIKESKEWKLGRDSDCLSEWIHRNSSHGTNVLWGFQRVQH